MSDLFKDSANQRLDQLALYVYTGHASKRARSNYFLAVFSCGLGFILIGFGTYSFAYLSLEKTIATIIIILGLILGLFAFLQYKFYIESRKVIDQVIKDSETEKTHILINRLSPYLDRSTLTIYSSANLLSQAGDEVVAIAASQSTLLQAYHEVALNQARSSFFCALVAAAIGLFFFIGAVSFIISKGTDASVISLLSGAMIEVISGINFYLYGQASKQLKDFQDQLDRTQRFLLANSMCEGLDDDHKQKARSKLIAAFVEIGIKQNETVAPVEQKKSE
jgi:hypothetical protein